MRREIAGSMKLMLFYFYFFH